MLTCAACGRQNAADARFCSGCGTPLASAPAPAREERKVVTVLFCDLVGFTQRSETMDPEDVRALLRGYHEHLRGELERFGGTVEKFIGDAVVAVFGAPTAHEDDPERAVRAALAIRDWAKEQDGLELRIAVNTGEALVTLGADPARGEGMVAGDVVNTAARLQSAAPANGILVGETTYRATRHAVEYREGEPVQAKGKAHPVATWQAVHARALVTVEREARAPLVGRARELSILVEALARSQSEREPQLVTLVGVPGIGKSRLVYELFRSIEQGDELVAWRRGRSLSYGEGVTFWALGEMVKAQAGILETDDAEGAEEKLRRATGSLFEPHDASWIERHLRPLVGLALGDELRGDPRDEAFAAWRRFFERLAEERPLVLVFEDLHWADDVVLDFVDELVEWASGVPLLVVGTARPELLARRPAWGGGKPNALTVSLSPLSNDETARLVASLLGRPVVSAEIQTALLAAAGGNPLFAEEFVRLVESGGDLDVPASVHGIIAARLDALAAGEKALLQDAAVVGRNFWIGALAAIGGEDARALEREVHVLERREFVRRERRSTVAGETEFAFRHALLRDVAYGQIPRAARAAKHRQAAEWIEALSPDRSEDRAEMLAHHYAAALDFAEASGQPTADLRARAFGALREAGDRAFALRAFAAAARFYERALELSPDGEARPHLLQRLARSLQLIGDDRAAATLAEASDALLAAGEREAAAETAAFRAELAWYAGRSGEVATHMERALALLSDGAASPARAWVLAQIARFRMLAGDARQAIEVGSEAVALAERLHLADVHASALTTIGVARWNLGETEGYDDVERAVEIALAANSYEASRAYFNLAGLASERGEPSQTIPLYEEAARTAERFGNASMRDHARALVVPYLYAAGRWQEARERADEFIARYEAQGGNYLLGAFYSGRALLRLAVGDTGGAAADAERAVSRALTAGDPQSAVGPVGRALQVFVALGRVDDARAIADKVLAEHGTTGINFDDLVWVAEAIGREAPIRSVIAAKPKRTYVDEAALALLDDDYERAAELYERTGWHSEAAAVRLRGGEQLIAAGRGAEAAEHLRQAIAFYRPAGATAYVRRAEALLTAHESLPTAGEA